MRRVISSLVLLAALLQTASAAPTIFLVRHAEKRTTDDKDPDLSEAGQKRADSLALMLKNAGITAIYVTEFKRTQQTAAPLSRKIGIAAAVVPATETDALIAQLKEVQGNAVVVGHSNTIPDIVRKLGVRVPPQIDDADYDNLFVLRLGSPVELLRLHFR